MMITSDFSASGSCSAISSAEEGKPSGGSPLCISRSISFIRSVLTPSNVTTRARAIRASLSSRATLRRLVLVAAPEPRARVVAALRGPVEPLVHAPHRVHAASVRGVGVVDDAVLQRERAHPGRLEQVCRRVGSGHGGELADRAVGGFQNRPDVFLAEVVFDDPCALLLLGDRGAEVVVEVAVARRRPREAPSHPALVGLELLEWGT